MYKAIAFILVLSIANIVRAVDTISCVQKQFKRVTEPLTGLADPSKAGDYKFDLLEYGQKPSFLNFSKPDIVTPSIKLPDFLADYSRKEKYTHDAYHDFDSSELALEAKVWLPQGQGPFPLLLLVHGNSDPGFDYLGELLASRGYIAAQVDQTYLNGLWGENGARGWILLEHLKLWRQWNQESNHKFYQKVDMERIALVGMSRGGEAVALAAGFNQWDKIPGKTEAPQFNFSIKAVIALAPMDGQYLHAGGANIIRNTNYLVLQGGHDADVYQYLGSRHWMRTDFDDGQNYLKQALYIYRANHINFNQSMSGGFHWGQRGDFDAELLTPSQQEHLTKFFVSAFLEATLFNRVEYRRLVQQPNTAEFGLPQDIMISRYKTSVFEPIENFEEDLKQTKVYRESSDNEQTPVESIPVEAIPIETVPIETVPIKVTAERLRNGTETTNHVLSLLLEKNTKTRVRFKASKKDLYKRINSGKFSLMFSIARSDSNQQDTCAQYNLLADAKVEVSKDSNLVYANTLESIGTLSPLLLSDFSELENEQLQYAATEPVLQTFNLPIQLKDIVENPVNSENQLEFELVFLPKQNVNIIIDDVGLGP